jgi:hypothetical protein
MNNNIVTAIGTVAVALMVCATAQALSVTTNFGPIELGGAPGLYGSATAVISIYDTTANGGTIDFAVTNTSLLTELELSQFANAFITEFQFDLPDDYTPIIGDCFVIARTGVRFSDGAGNPVVATGIDRTLNWSYGPGTGGGLYARANEATENSNKNAIFSDNALNGSGIPVEDYAVGFLKEKWDYAVFDEIIFRVKFENSAPIAEEDLFFFESDNLTLKFQGGGGSIWVPNHFEVPEPASLTLISAGVGLAAGMAMVRRRMRRK